MSRRLNGTDLKVNSVNLASNPTRFSRNQISTREQPLRGLRRGLRPAAGSGGLLAELPVVLAARDP